MYRISLPSIFQNFFSPLSPVLEKSQTWKRLYYEAINLRFRLFSSIPESFFQRETIAGLLLAAKWRFFLENFVLVYFYLENIFSISYWEVENRIGFRSKLRQEIHFKLGIQPEIYDWKKDNRMSEAKLKLFLYQLEIIILNIKLYILLLFIPLFQFTKFLIQIF